jgi:hypothetical protein
MNLAPPAASGLQRTTGKLGLDVAVRAISNLGKEFSCTICLSLLNDPLVLPCTHAFCASCLANLQQGAAPKRPVLCPHCRQPFTRRELRPDVKLTRLVQLYRRIHPSVQPGEELSQVGSFSQLARGLATQLPASDWSGQDATGCSSKPPPAGDTSQDLALQLLCEERLDTGSVRSSGHGSERHDDGGASGSAASPRLQGLDLAETPVQVRGALTTPPTVVLSSASAAEDPARAAAIPPGRIAFRPLDSPLSAGVAACASAAAAAPADVSWGNVQVIPSSVPEAAIAREQVALAVAGCELPVAASQVRGAALSPALPAEQMRTKEAGPREVAERVTDSTTPPAPPRKKDPFREGAVVTVARRMGPGENKPGGIGIVVKNHGDGTIDVKYAVLGSREKRVKLEFVLPGQNVDADSVMGRPAATLAAQEECAKDRGIKAGGRKDVAAPPPKPAEMLASAIPSSDSSAPVVATASCSLPDAANAAVPATAANAAVPATAANPRRDPERTSGQDRKLQRTLPSDASMVSASGPASTTTTASSTRPGLTAKPPVILTTGRKPKRPVVEQVQSLQGVLCDTDEENAFEWTHCVAFDGVDGRAPARSAAYLIALSLGLWILSPSWLDKSLASRRWLNEAPFEVDTDLVSQQARLASGGPKRARAAVAAQKSFGGSSSGGEALLFMQTHVYLLGRFDKTVLDRAGLLFLLSNSGGQLVSGLDPAPRIGSDISRLFIVAKDWSSAQAAPEWRAAQRLLEGAAANNPDSAVWLVDVNWVLDSLCEYRQRDPAAYSLRTGRRFVGHG